MKIRAALFSALLFPGLGQLLVLKRRNRALLFMVTAFAALLFLLRTAFTAASRIAEQVTAGTLPLDPQAIAAQIEATNSGGMAGNIAATVLLVAWLASILDALLTKS